MKRAAAGRPPVATDVIGDYAAAMTLVTPTRGETIGRFALVVVGIVQLILGDYLLGGIVAAIGLALLIVPRLGPGVGN